MSLFISYLKTAIRNLARHRIYSAINIIGCPSASPSASSPTLVHHDGHTTPSLKTPTTSIGLRQKKKSYGDRVMSGVPLSLGPASAKRSPTYRLSFSNDSGDISIEDRSFRALLGFVDPSFLDIFPFQSFMAILRMPFKTSICTDHRKNSTEVFQQNQSVGELLPIQRGEEIHNYTITGILKNVPKNSTLVFEVLLPYEQFRS